jgi:hypothetical protein
LKGKKMGTKKQIILLLYVLAICVFAGSTVAADTVIPYSLNNGWTYEESSPGSLSLTANPSGGIIASIDLPTGIDDGGLVASMHDVPDYSLRNHGFIQLEYSSFSYDITGNPEGLDLCLEIKFDYDDPLYHEMAIVVSQEAAESFFGTWFGTPEYSSYYETPVPDGFSLAEGALGLYSDGSLVLPYFMDAAGSVLYPFAAWDVSGITGTHEYFVDNDLEGTTMAGGTIIASVNLERVVYGPGTPPSPPEDPIEEILDFVDESVEDGTLTGDGPDNSGDNRLNALINMLEEAQSLIEAGLYEEACDQLWSTYRKCDGELRPPDFVTGEAAEDLAYMILAVMDEL